MGSVLIEDGVGFAVKAIRSITLRPGTAIILIVLLLVIAVAGLIQLWAILSPPG